MNRSLDTLLGRARAVGRISMILLLWVMLVGLAAILVLSYVREETIRARFDTCSLSLTARRGVIFLLGDELSGPVPFKAAYYNQPLDGMGPDAVYRMRFVRVPVDMTVYDEIYDPPRGLMGFDAGHRAFPVDFSTTPVAIAVSWVTFPLVAPLLLLGSIAAAGLLRARRARMRRRENLCSRCGYDLRAATSKRCPECGEGLEI